MTDLKQAIEGIAEKHLPDENHFIVAVNISEKTGKKHLNILLDADEGVTIRACAKLSRAISEELEANEIMPDAYVLEVSSPGLDFPLSSKRQFDKNIGRELKISLTSGEDIQGKLVEVTEAGVKLLAKKKKEKGKKATEEEVPLLFEDMKKSIVQVSFK